MTFTPGCTLFNIKLSHWNVVLQFVTFWTFKLNTFYQLHASSKQWEAGRQGLEMVCSSHLKEGSSGSGEV